MVALNIIAQIMFFIVNIFILPWLASLITDKFGTKLPGWIDKPTLVIKTWTVSLFSDLIRIPLLFLSFNRPEDIEFSVLEGELNVKYNYNSSKYYWYNPIMQIGKYLANVVWILMGPFLTVLALAFMLPDTFSGVVAGLGQWTALQSGTTNLEYFGRMWSAFADIIGNRLIMGGLNENAVLLVIFGFIAIFLSDYYIELYTEGKSSEDDEDYDEDENESQGVPGEALFTFPWMALIIIIFNVVFWLVNPALYATASAAINSVGMILLLIMIIRVLASIILLCSKGIITVAFKIFTRG